MVGKGIRRDGKKEGKMREGRIAYGEEGKTRDWKGDKGGKGSWERKDDGRIGDKAKEGPGACVSPEIILCLRP